MIPLLKKVPWLKIAKFGLVGGSALALDFVIYIVLTRYFHAHYLIGRTASILAAFSWNFYLNRNWTFRAQTGDIKKQATRFVIVMAITSLLNLFFMHVAISQLNMHDLVAIALVSLIIMAINFSAHSFWSYRTESAPSVKSSGPKKAQPVKH